MPLKHDDQTILCAAAAIFLTAVVAFAQEPATQKAPEDCACKNKSAVNLLPNGEFETTAKNTSLPEHWSTSRPYNVRVIDLSSSFRRAVQIQGSQAQMAGRGIELVSDPIPVQMQHRYRCRGYIKSQAPRQDVSIRGYVNVPRVVDGRVQQVEQLVFETRKPWKQLDDWRHFSFEFDMLPVTVNGRTQPIDHLRVVLVSYGSGGTCWFDDVRIEAAGDVKKNKPAQ